MLVPTRVDHTAAKDLSKKVEDIASTVKQLQDSINLEQGCLTSMNGSAKLFMEMQRQMDDARSILCKFL